MISHGYPAVNPWIDFFLPFGYRLDMPKKSSTSQRQHSEPVLVRFTPEHLRLVDAAAERAGLSRTGWVRSTLIRVAREELAHPEPEL